MFIRFYRQKVSGDRRRAGNSSYETGEILVNEMKATGDGGNRSLWEKQAFLHELVLLTDSDIE
jgi:hypothetical protein